MNYCASPYRHARRDTRPVIIGDPENGGVLVGGGEPVVRQSMITCSTLDTDACIEQSMALVEAGCQIVRITAQTKRYAANLEPIIAGIRARGSNVPVVADIHFKPDAALEAVKWCEMVRVNPGNYADSKKFDVREYTDEQYADGVSSHRGRVRAARRGMQNAQPRTAYRHQPRLAQRPHHEPLRRHAAGHGRERARVRPHRPRSRLSTISSSR